MLVPGKKRGPDAAMSSAEGVNLESAKIVMVAHSGAGGGHLF